MEWKFYLNDESILDAMCVYKVSSYDITLTIPLHYRLVCCLKDININVSRKEKREGFVSVYYKLNSDEGLIKIGKFNSPLVLQLSD